MRPVKLASLEKKYPFSWGIKTRDNSSNDSVIFLLLNHSCHTFTLFNLMLQRLDFSYVGVFIEIVQFKCPLYN